MQPFLIPKPLSTLFRLLPQYPHSFALAHALNLVLADTLRAQTLAQLRGKQICLRILDANIMFYFTLDQHGIKSMQASPTPDLSISANTYDFMQLALRKEDPDTLFFSRRLLMEGDTELGLLLKNTLDALELPAADWRTLLPPRLLRGLQQKIRHG